MSTDWSDLDIYGRAVWFTMSLARDAGLVAMNKRQIISFLGTSKLTVLRATANLEKMGWVEAAPSTDPVTGNHNPTLYALTSVAPHPSEIINLAVDSEQ